MSMRVAKRIGAPLNSANIDIRAIGGGIANRARQTATIFIYPDGQSSPVTCTSVCVRHLGISTPSSAFPTTADAPWNSERLADAYYNEPGPIELLIGANVLPALLRPGLLSHGDLAAQNTAFGWTVFGRQRTRGSREAATCLSCLQDEETPKWHAQLIALLQRFWELEDVPPAQRSSPTDRHCEQMFAQHQRDNTGRYVVRLPVKPGAARTLGTSEASARATLRNLHRRMNRQPEFAEEYRLFMDTYEQMGHMRRLQPSEIDAPESHSNYIPHHGIWQQGNDGPKLRVVFDASRPTSTGVSLNDVLCRGPKLQRDIWTVLLRWRTYKFAFCADIRMMFRQICVDERDVDLQRILWAPRSEDPVQHFQLRTVTYGTSCAPYLSLRTLQQLCDDEGDKYPRAKISAMRDRYVDDVLSGDDNIEGARELRDQLIQLMAAGGFPLRKWVANHLALLEDLNIEERLRPAWITFTKDEPVKELGVRWRPQDDAISLSFRASNTRRLSKREVLSELAALFDPCGWIAPTTLLAKMLVQDLWRARLDWDEELPSSMARRWLDLRQSFESVSSMSVPRWIGSTSDVAGLTIHVFADASRRAMAAVAYSRVDRGSQEAVVRLLVAKTKLSPIRSLRPSSTPAPRMTIPRLELRAALIAARLLRTICDELGISIHLCCAWSDSRIALHWMESTESTGNSVVDSYVQQIQELVPCGIWRHVPSSENPADVASRGVDLDKLAAQQWWFGGPPWLAKSSSAWPASRDERDQPLVQPVSAQCLQLGATDCFERSLPSLFSDLNRLLRFMVRLRRWVRLKLKRQPAVAVLQPMTPIELNEAFEACVKESQSQTFSRELELLSTNKPVPLKGPLSSLDPFLCPQGILRVGGRLQHAMLSLSQRHPPILEASSPLANLVVGWAHVRAMHGGFGATQGHVCQRAWLIGGSRQIRRHMHCQQSTTDASTHGASPA